MYAIVEIAGQQFKAKAGKRLYVHRLEDERGSVVEFEKVLLIDADGKVKVGAPTVKGAKIVCECFHTSEVTKCSSSRKNAEKGSVS